MLQHNQPDDFVISTGINFSLKYLVEAAFEEIGIENWQEYISINEKFLRPAETFETKR